MAAKFPVFPAVAGISSIFPALPPFGRENSEANQALTSQFRRTTNREFARANRELNSPNRESSPTDASNHTAKVGFLWGGSLPAWAGVHVIHGKGSVIA
jgi:hypothetical protein